MTSLPDGLQFTDEDELWDYIDNHSGEYETLKAAFTTLLPTPQMNDEVAFELLNNLFEDAIAHDERDVFDQLVLQLREKRPEVYASEAHFMLDWLISNALANGRYQDTHTYALELAQLASRHLDTIQINLNKLAYHNQLDTVYEMLQIIWSILNGETQADYFDWAVEEVALLATNYTLYHYIENTAEPNFADPDLLTAIAQYVIPKPAGVEYHLKQLAHQSNHAWQLSDFTFTPLPKHQKSERIPDPIPNNIGDLTAEFMGYLRHVEGVGYPKGDLVNRKYGDYIMAQLEKRLTAGKISKKKSQGGKRAVKTSAATSVIVPLIPDRASFEEELLQNLHFLNPNPHIAGAMFELLPAWLRFLESRQLITAEQKQTCLKQMAGLADNLAHFWGESPTDPTLLTAATEWRQKAGLTT